MIIELTDGYLNNFYSIDASSYKLIQHEDILTLSVDPVENTMLHSYMSAHNNLYNFNIFDVDNNMLNNAIASLHDNGTPIINIISMLYDKYDLYDIYKIECSLKKISVDGRYYLKAVIDKIYVR